jgi:hypothetical protein
MDGWMRGPCQTANQTGAHEQLIKRVRSAVARATVKLANPRQHMCACVRATHITTRKRYAHQRKDSTPTQS